MMNEYKRRRIKQNEITCSSRFWAKTKPPEIVEIDVAGPKKGEVIIKLRIPLFVIQMPILYRVQNPEGVFPTVLGSMEGGDCRRSWEKGVTSCKPGDHVIPLYTPECGKVVNSVCQVNEFYVKLSVKRRKGLMPDGTTRFFHIKAKPGFIIIWEPSTFSEYRLFLKSL